MVSSTLNEMDETFNGMDRFRLHGMNGSFVKFLLSRITSFVDQESGVGNNFEHYFQNSSGKPYEVEHIWADKFSEHRDEFDQATDFDEYRNRIGGLVLLPRGTNQSYGAKPYEQKLEHYLKENLLVKSLHGRTYDNNPNFTSMTSRLSLPFKPHDEFKKADVEERQELYQRICELIWNADLK